METIEPSAASPYSDGVSVIIPMHNEREAIAATLTQLHQTLTDFGAFYEIIVVDDGSTDGSANAIAHQPQPVRLIQHETNRGYGAALKSGFGAARFPWVAFLDADGSYRPADLKVLLHAAGDADMVVGARQGYHERASWARRLGKAILVPLATYLVERRIPDLNSGMRVIRRSLLERYWALLPDGFSLTTTITMALLSSGRRVTYLPIPYEARTGHSKIRPIRDMRNFLYLILRTMTYFRPLKVYIPLSALFILMAVGVVIFSKLLTGDVMDITSLFLFITGLQLFVIGVVADLVLKLLATKQ